MARYAAIPKSSHAAVEVATGTAIKTLLQVATPSTTLIRVVAWGISFDGIVPTNPAGVVTLGDFDVAATGLTGVSPEDWGHDDNQASLCVSGTSATGYSATGEGSIAGSRLLDVQEIHPQQGYALWYPEGKSPVIKVSRFLRIRALFSVDVNSLPWVIWDEPA